MERPPSGVRLTVPQAMQRALAACQRAEWSQAEALCRVVLEAQPDHFDALHLGGVAAAQSGRPQQAVALLSKALSVGPDSAEVHNHLGVVYGGLGRHAEALASYERAAALEPGYAVAHYNRGNTLRDLQRHAEALDSYARAVELEPHFAEAHHNRGDLLLQLGSPLEASESYERAIAAAPTYVAAHVNRGVALGKLERHEEARASYERAIALEPGHAAAHFNRGNALRDLSLHAQALESYARALALKPDLAEAHHNQGAVLARFERYAEAIESFDRALACNPRFADAYTSRGNALRALKRDREALDSYARALEVAPDRDFRLGAWLDARMRICDWADIDDHIALLKARIARGEPASAPFPVLAMTDSPATQRAAAQIWVDAKWPERRGSPVPPRVATHARIRVGYFSANYHEHPVSHLMAELFERHDRAKFELTAFSFGPDTKDAMRGRVAAAFDRFIDVRGASDRDVTSLARTLEIDIAVDLMGFTHSARTGIFAGRAAPLQVNYLGYPGTMAAGYIDYLVADATLVPPQHRRHYAERIVYLPDSYQANDTRRAIAGRMFSRADAGLPESGFVFCCFNNNFKITPGMFDIWMRVLGQVEGSVLWLFADNDWAADNLRKEAARRGIAAHRLVFARRMPPALHLARHRLADLFLDTLPYNAHTTCSDALWAGLPVLTCPGESFAGRVAASLLNAIRLPELVVGSPEAYEAQAVELANSPDRLREIARKLESHRLSAPLFDTRLFASHLEAAYAAMYERHLAGLAPEDLHVRQVVPARGACDT